MRDQPAQWMSPAFSVLSTPRKQRTPLFASPSPERASLRKAREQAISRAAALSPRRRLRFEDEEPAAPARGARGGGSGLRLVRSPSPGRGGDVPAYVEDFHPAMHAEQPPPRPNRRRRRARSPPSPRRRPESEEPLYATYVTPLSAEQRQRQRGARMSGIIHRFKANAILARVLLEWRQTARFLVGYYALKRRAVARQTPLRQRYALERWRAAATAAIRLRHTTARMERRRLRRLLKQWRANARIARKERVGFRRAVGRFSNGPLGQAWNRWQSFIAEQRLVLLRVVQQIRLRLVARALEAWRDMLVQRARLRVVVGRLLHRMNHKALLSSLNRWMEMSYTQRRFRAAAERVVRKLQQRCMDEAFNSWKFMTKALSGKAGMELLEGAPPLARHACVSCLCTRSVFTCMTALPYPVS